MREMMDVASVMKDTIAKLRARTLESKLKFQKEVLMSSINLDKLDAFTTDLSTANKDVEAMLGSTGSNFPTSGGKESPKVPTPSVDTGVVDGAVDGNGVRVIKAP